MEVSDVRYFAVISGLLSSDAIIFIRMRRIQLGKYSDCSKLVEFESLFEVDSPGCEPTISDMD